MSAKIPGNNRWGSSVPALQDLRYSESVDRGLAILTCFTAERPILGVREVAEEVGMRTPTTHRYMQTLAVLGLLEQDRSRKYRMTLAVTNLGMSAMAETSIREHAREYLEELRRRTTYTVSIATLDGSEIVYVDRLPGRRRGDRSVNLGPGSRLPAYCTAMGKILLAHLPARERRETIVEMKLKNHGLNTVKSKTALRAQLESMTKEGIAINDQELTDGLSAIAAPVRDESEVVAAVGIAAYGSTISPENMAAQLRHVLIATADQISARLGYRRPDERRL